MRDASGTSVSTVRGSDIPIDAGGWEITCDAVQEHIVFGGDTYGVWAADDTKFDRTDLLRASLLPDSILNSLPGRGSLPSNGEQNIGSFGAYALRIAPTDKNRVVMVLDGYCIKKDDWTGPQKWQMTNFPVKKSLSNTGYQRLWNYKCAIDPATKTSWLIGYMGQGAYYTIDDGATAALVNNSSNDYQIAEPTLGYMKVVTKAQGQAQFRLRIMPDSGAGSVSIGSVTLDGVAMQTITVVPPTGATLCSQIAAQMNADATFAATYEAQLRVDAGGRTITLFDGENRSTSSNEYPVLVAYDPSSATASSRKQGVVMSIYGKGIYRSTTGVNGTFTLMAGSPKDTRQLHVDGSGRIWAVQEAFYGRNQAGSRVDQVFLFSGTSWAGVNVPVDSSGNNRQDAVTSMCFGETDSRVFMKWTSSEMLMSINGGSSWLGPWLRKDQAYNGTDWTFVAEDIPWLGFAHGVSGLAGNGCITFDKVNNRLYESYGIGAAYMTPPPNTYPGSPVPTWTSRAAGGKMIVAYRILSIPGRPYPLFMGADRKCFQITDFSKSPTRYGPGTELNQGKDIDYAGNNPDFVACSAMFFAGSQEHSYNLSAGRPDSWVPFPVQPDTQGSGGSMTVSTDQLMIYCGASDRTPRVTKNRGASWADVQLVNAWPANTKGMLQNAIFGANRYVITADKTTTGVFYLYCDNGNTGYNNQGVHKLDYNVSDVATKLWGGPFDAFSFFYSAKLRCIPGRAGEMLFTSGDVGGENPAPNRLWRLTDNGSGGLVGGAPVVVSGFWEVKDFGFGKKLDAGDPYPTIFVVGWYGATQGASVYGVWKIDHFLQGNQIVTKISDYGNDHIDQITAVSGDMNVYGRCYLGYQGSGYDLLEPENRIALTVI